VWKHALSLLAELESGDNVLVEALQPSTYQHNDNAVKWSASKEHANRVCVTVCRGTDNKPRVTSVSYK
jgi:hypothetical protein